MPLPSVSPLVFDVRKFDRERFVTTLFMQPEKRHDAIVLYAFNAEIARIKSLVREPLAGAIRLQWWRDVLSQTRPHSEVTNHPIAQPLTQMLKEGRLPADLLFSLVDAKERDLNNESFESLAQMVLYADATAGNLGAAVLHVTGAVEETSLASVRGASIAYALTGLMRSIPVHLAQGWMTIPLDVLAEHSLSAEDVTKKADLSKPVRRIVEQALSTVSIARKQKVPKAALPVCLVGTLAHGHGKRFKKCGWNPFDGDLLKPTPMPLRLIWATMRGRF
jgi:phytoene synthase